MLPEHLCGQICYCRGELGALDFLRLVGLLAAALPRDDDEGVWQSARSAAHRW